MHEYPRAQVILQAMADPVRFAILERMGTGPVSVSELVACTGCAQSKVSNHLGFLRRNAIVRATKIGRQVLYEVTESTVVDIMESLGRSPSVHARVLRLPPEMVVARTCYDHLAGRLGVALFEALASRKAIERVAMPALPVRKVRSALGAVALGPSATDVFGRLGVDIVAARRRRRQFATACVDWTEDRPHLGGSLGAGLLERLLELEWVERRPQSRSVGVTPRGYRGFADLGVELSAGLPRG